jgi:hypothetical protein
MAEQKVEEINPRLNNSKIRAGLYRSLTDRQRNFRDEKVAL